jgi:hypothetical protein
MRITPGGKYGYSQCCCCSCVCFFVGCCAVLRRVLLCNKNINCSLDCSLLLLHSLTASLTASLFISLPLQQIVIMANTSIRRFSSQLPRGFYVQQNMFGLNKKLTQKNTLQVTLLVIRNNHKRHAYMYLTVIYS